MCVSEGGWKYENMPRDIEGIFSGMAHFHSRSHVSFTTRPGKSKGSPVQPGGTPELESQERPSDGVWGVGASPQLNGCCHFAHGTATVPTRPTFRGSVPAKWVWFEDGLKVMLPAYRSRGGSIHMSCPSRRPCKSGTQ